MRWDLFCRVIDNHGDLGVCWRLACQLAALGGRVRLVVDDASALAWMAPQGAAGVDVVTWPGDDAAAAALAPAGDVVIETFGCDPPAAFVAAMAAGDAPPRWINLEYLSAEAWVERSHGLPSPQLAGPGRGLTKWFFFPGFTPATGGLLREPGLLDAQRGFDGAAWLASLGHPRHEGERVVSLFCYPQAPVERLVAALAQRPTLLLLAGAAREPAPPWPAALRVRRLPWLTQPDYDRLLWSCDINAVRGEDSLVRAAWAGAPLLWQLYPQHDGAHGAKLAAFAERFGAAAVPGLETLWRRWNGLEPGALQLPDAAMWDEASRRWRDALLGQDDLVTRLLRFVAAIPGQTRTSRC